MPGKRVVQLYYVQYRTIYMRVQCYFVRRV